MVALCANGRKEKQLTDLVDIRTGGLSFLAAQNSQDIDRRARHPQKVGRLLQP